MIAKVHPQNQGIVAAWRTGAAAARGRLVAIIDADLQYQPEDMLRLRRELDRPQRRRGPGLAQPGRARARTRATTCRAGSTRMLNATFGMALQDNKTRLRPAAPRRSCRTSSPTRATTTTGSRSSWWPRTPRATRTSEIETLFEPRRQGESFLEKTAYKAVAAQLRRHRARPPGSTAFGRRTHDVAEQFLRPAPGRWTAAGRARPSREVRWRAYMATFEQTHWMMSPRRRALLRVARARRSGCRPPHMRELQDEKLRRLVRHAYRNVPYYRGRMQEAASAPRTSAARPTCTSCRS